MAAADYYTQVQQAYIAYYGRPADPAGLIYWANQLDQAGGNLNSIINAFGNSAESTALYSSGNLYTEINQIYLTLFGRSADTAGANWYVEQIQTGQMTLASIALNVYNGAQGSDASALAAKLGYAQAFTNELLQNSTEAGAYAGNAAANNARAALLNVTDANSEQTAINDLPATIAAIGTTTGQSVNLTTGVDNVVAATINADLSPYSFNGQGPTLNAGDTITGATGGTNNTLNIVDQYGQGNDVIPAGVTISNIQNINLNTQGNAGGAAGGGAGAGSGNLSGVFDVSGISGVQTVTVNSAGNGTDTVKASSTTNIVDNQNGVTTGGVQTYGGQNVTIAANGSGNVTVGSTTIANANPTGTVNVTETNSATVKIYGGTSVTVNDSGLNGSVTVGNNAPGQPSEPTGTVTINNTGAGTGANVYGGTDATVSVAGAAVNVGSLMEGSNTVYAPSGNITVTDTAAVAYAKNPVTGATSGSFNAVNVIGGKNVSVTTNTGSVSIGGTQLNTGSSSVGVAGQNPTGDVTVVDTATGAGASVSVFGGANVNVSNAGGAVTVGGSAGTATFVPTGTVTVTDTAPLAYDNANAGGGAGVFNSTQNAVNVQGGTTVNVTTNAGNVTVGNAAYVAGLEPSGAVTVVNSSTGNVSVYGGTDDTVTAAGGTVVVGAGTAQTNASGNVTVTQSAVETGGVFGSSVTVDGGANVTVNTTGGSVTAGVAATPVTGAVSITDTFVGTSNDAFSVVGGTTVSITTTASGGAINVGSVAPQLNAAGTALANGNAYASGNVTIVNESVAGTTAAGASNVYGTGAATVNTNGATAVSITGAGTVNITDEETTKATGGANAGKAIGTSTLATVNLDGVSGAATITSDALTNLSIADSGTVTSTAVTVNETPAHALSLTLSNNAVNTAGGQASVTDATATSITVTTSGTAASAVGITANKATSITFNNTAAVSTAAAATAVAHPDLGASGTLINDAALTTITATGSGALNLGDLSGAAKLTTIDATKSTGGVTVGINSTVTSFNGAGSSGNDVVTLNGSISTVNAANNAINNTIVGGSGTNTLVVENVVGNYLTDTALGNNANIKGFSNLALGSGAAGTFDASGFSGLSVSNTAALGATFENVAAGATLSLTPVINAGADAFNVGYFLKNSSGSNDTLSLNVGTDGTTQYTSGVVKSTDGSNAINATVQTTGIENLKVNSLGYVSPVGSASANINTVVIEDSAAKSVTVTGDQYLALTVQTDAGLAVTSATSNVTSIDASKATGTVDVSGVALAAAGGTVTGGSGLLIAGGETSSQAGVDSITTGSGGGVITVGAGGSWIAGTPGYGAGSETINLSASTATVDTIKVGDGAISTFNGAKGGVSGFQVTANAKTSDQLTFATSGSNTPKTVLGNVASATIVSSLTTTFPTLPLPTTVTAAQLAAELDSTGALAAAIINLTYTVSNGVITFAGTGGHQLSDFSSGQLIAAAEIILNLTGGNLVATFQTGGSTYVVTDDGAQTLALQNGASHANLDSITDLVGVTGVTGFGGTAAAGTIVTTDVTSVAGHKSVSGTTALVYDETGFSHVVLGGSELAGSASTTFNNLAASALIDVAAGASVAGNVSVNQTAAAGSDSLTLNFLGAGSLNTLTLNGDNALTVVGNGVDSITSLVDSSNTLATINVTGGAVSIGSITDTALTLIDASGGVAGNSGTLSLGTASTALSQAGLTIKGALGGDTIYASGAGDTITIGDSSHAIAGNATIVASGTGDTITLTNAAGHTYQIAAAASGDTISVDGGTVNLGSVLNQSNGFYGQLGSNDTINLGSGNDTLWVGNSSTVHLGTAATPFSGTVALSVQGDLTGATSAGSYAETVVTGADQLSAHLSISFNNVNVAGTALSEGFAGGNAVNSQVNVASATTLAQALDLAVSQASVLNAQLGGGSATTVANGVLQQKAGTGLIDYFHFQGNTYIVEANNASTSNAAHTALAAGDVVIELTGNVDVTTALASNSGHTVNIHALG